MNITIKITVPLSISIFVVIYSSYRIIEHPKLEGTTNP